ncbi:chondroitin sulfate N-acetylgalactosaminyltransferase 2-like [Convolutriloba macropyga]|uniref:chondroitin sulfate N-acetylgalactosaminyltransferase 2-like n=1 Tax=Convolutriloba macropyga TaxID=536237 RepID=UPI003F51DE6A
MSCHLREPERHDCESFSLLKRPFTGKGLDNSEQFSRGRLINTGAAKATKLFGPNVKLYFTDVDVFSTRTFLQRCKSFTLLSKSIYFPILWSQNRPREQNSQKNLNYKLENDFTFHDNSKGRWQKYGYGMFCITDTDFNQLGKLDEFFSWGREDTNFARKALKSGLAIFRGRDPGLYHKWHPKHCSQADKENTAAWHYWITGINNCEQAMSTNRKFF